MPRYFFHVMDGKAIIDHEGVILADKDQAKREAIKTASGILADDGMAFWQGKAWTMTVTGEDNITIFSLRFQADED